MVCLFSFGLPASAHSRSVCPATPAAPVFLPWADPAPYSLIDDGGMEARDGSWQLTGGARFVAGNEPFYVRAPGDAWSLAIPAGGSATSDAVCVGLRHPTLRFFSRTTGGVARRLQVSLDYTDLAGFKRSHPIAVVGLTSSWRPTPPIPIVINAITPLTSTNVRFRFDAAGGDWWVDDVYVDPYGKG
jgi:hypothetical protein